MGLGSAMAGGNPTAGRRQDDFYPTPDECTVALLKNFNFGNRTIHECAAGDLSMSDVIEGFGYKVVSSDLVRRTSRDVIEQDFLTLEKPMGDAIITNPPFKLARPFIEHAMGTLKVTYLALLLKSTFWHASTRHDLYLAYPPRFVCPLLWRPDFLKKGAPTMDCAWFIWVQGYKGEPIYRPLKKPAIDSTASR